MYAPAEQPAGCLSVSRAPGGPTGNYRHSTEIVETKFGSIKPSGQKRLGGVVGGVSKRPDARDCGQTPRRGYDNPLEGQKRVEAASPD